MKKRLLSLITAAALMVGMLPAAFAGYENFTSKTTYPAGQSPTCPQPSGTRRMFRQRMNTSWWTA
nr:hypothetical protein [Butyricicoccus sp. AF10-3]